MPDPQLTFAALSARLEEIGKKPRRIVSWYIAGQVSEASYTIVPLDDDTFTLYQPSGRGECYQAVDQHKNARIFATEEAVCEYVWQRTLARMP